jgi:threonine aldolase
MIWVENTQVGLGGMLMSLENLAEIQAVAKRHGLIVNMDGARIFNAALAMGVEARQIAQYADSVMFCISKGLSAPVGSLLVGAREFVEKATWHCKRIGGRMRQAGVIAAAGIVALEQMVDRLQEDHDNARFLAEQLQDVPALELDLNQVQTNIILARLKGERLSQPEAIRALYEKGLWVLASGRDGLRLVTHYGISRSDCAKAAEICRSVFGR